MSIHTQAEPCFKEAKRHTRRKLLPLKSLEKKLDKVCSLYVRMKDADEGGTVSCVSCRKLMHWKDADCGHWIKRQHRGTRWDLRNLGVQCGRCNRYMGGNMDEMAAHILRTHGADAIEEMLAMKRAPVKHTRTDLEEMIALYQSKLAELER